MITLAELATNSDDKLVQGFINEIITDSYLLSAMTFDDCLTSSGTSDLSYSYKRVKTPMVAKFRALNTEPEKTKPEIERITTSIGILSDSWDMDRVTKQAAEDLYQLYIEGSKKAIIRAFNHAVINGDTKVEANGFDGLNKAVTGSSTELVSKVDLSTIDKDTALAFASEMDTLLSLLVRDPDAILVSKGMKVKINAICRILGISNVTTDSVGHRVSTWDGIRLEEMKDGALNTDDIYPVCLGLDEFHGITLNGSDAISVNLPDWTKPGAVKTGDAEFVCGCALKQTKAAGVLRPKGYKPAEDDKDDDGDGGEAETQTAKSTKTAKA